MDRLVLFRCGHGDQPYGPEVTSCECGKCNFYSPPPPPEAPAAGRTRHLLYHVYPVRGNDVWRWNLAQLRQRLGLFNGRRVIGVAVGPETEGADAVAAELPGCEIVEVANDKDLREVTTYAALHERVSGLTGPGDVTLWGHTKGVTSAYWASGARRWAEELYSACLDYWPLVRRVLREYPLAGPFLREGRHFAELPHNGWHFSGAWRWFRNADWFARGWRVVPKVWVGVEAMPSVLFRRHEAACLGFTFSDKGLCLYEDAFWRRRAGPAMSRWHADHAPDRYRPSLLTCVLVSHNKPRLVREAIESVRAQTGDEWELVVTDSGALVGELAAAYGGDPRVTVVTSRDGPRCQGWQINDVFRRGLVRGDLVCYLADDDVYEPGAFAAFGRAARTGPFQDAWYGRLRQTFDGRELPGLGEVGIGGSGGVRLRCKVDGMQICHRTTVRCEWPEGEDFETRRQADGIFLDSFPKPIHPIPEVVGTHRFVPESAHAPTPAGPRQVE